VMRNKYITEQIHDNKDTFSVGDKVRILNKKNMFEDKMLSRYSSTVFTVTKVNRNSCEIEDEAGNELTVKNSQLLKVKIEKNNNLHNVLKAGQEGRDPGCHGSKYKEKDVALAVALKLGKYIEDNMKDVRVVYTRKTDVFLELQARAEIANKAKADLFICIHCNSACYFDKKKKKEICSSEISGVESWVMGLNKSEANLEVSKRENEVILLEKDYTKQYGGFDPNSPEANILFSLYQNVPLMWPDN